MEKEIELNGKKYIEVGSVQTIPKKNKKGMEYCIVRTYSAGVFAGWYNRKTKGKEGTVYDARRLWYWDGACSLSELAVKGTTKPDKCKFPCTVSEIQLKEIIEIIPCTEVAKKIIESIKVWTND